MVDIMYDTTFDKEDVLEGTITVSSHNIFLQEKFGWTQGVSTMTDVKEKNRSIPSSGHATLLLSATQA